jgi:hypothetical protein
LPFLENDITGSEPTVKMLDIADIQGFEGSDFVTESCIFLPLFFLFKVDITTKGATVWILVK